MVEKIAGFLATVVFPMPDGADADGPLEDERVGLTSSTNSAIMESSIEYSITSCLRTT